jgi:prolycopene isomerase
MSAFTASVVFNGGFLPRGGIRRIVDLLETVIVTHGGEVRKKAPVKSILVKGGKALGVILENGEEIRAESVVSNSDARTTFLSLVGEDKLPPDFIARLRKIEIMYSAFNVFLGVKAQGLGMETLAPAICCFPGYDLDEQYLAMQKGEIERTSFWIGIPTLTNPFMAPEGHHLVVLYVPVPYRLKGKDWRHPKEDFTQRLINMAEKAIPGLRKDTVLVDAASPDTLVRYTGNSEGAVAGWACTPEADALRPANRTPIEGLFLAGHWTFPGPGTGSVMHSGWLAASMIP